MGENRSGNTVGGRIRIVVWPEISAYNATYGLARVLSERGHHIWKQLVMVSTDSDESQMRARTDVFVVFCLALAAAVFIKVPALFGIQCLSVRSTWLH